MEWPEHFPENCPPANSIEAGGTVHRFVRNNPPENNDFRSNRLLHPQQDFGENICQACGLSVYRDKNDLIRKLRRLPAKRKCHIATGNLNPDTGKILPTPTQGDSHNTWWVPIGIRAEDYFSVI